MLVLLVGKEDVDIKIKQIGTTVVNGSTGGTKPWIGVDGQIGACNVDKFGYIVKENRALNQCVGDMKADGAVALIYCSQLDNKSFDEHASELLPTYFHGASVGTALQMVKSECDSKIEEEDSEEDDVEEEDAVEGKKAPAEE